MYLTLDHICREPCKRCGSKLILNEGDFGRFYGCARYPKCCVTARDASGKIQTDGVAASVRHKIRKKLFKHLDYRATISRYLETPLTSDLEIRMCVRKLRSKPVEELTRILYMKPHLVSYLEEDLI